MDTSVVGEQSVEPPFPHMIPQSAWLSGDGTDAQNVVAVAIRKGGTGKTSLTLQLADAFARLGLNVLVIDTDPQGNTSMILGHKVRMVPAGTDRFGKPLEAPDRFTVVDVIENGEDGVVDDAVQKVEWPYDQSAPFVRGGPLTPGRLGTIGTIPCYKAIESIAKGWSSNDLNRLRRSLLNPPSPGGIAPNRRWDVVLIDTPPGGTDIGRMAIKAAHKALLVTAADAFGMEAIEQTLEYLNDIRTNYLYPELDIMGLVLSYFDPRRRLTENQMSDFAAAQASGHVVSEVELWPERMPRRSVISDAQDLRAPVSALLADSASRTPATIVCQVSESIALRILERIGHPQANDLKTAWSATWPRPLTRFVTSGREE
jgi:chromosome partitioning protein